eukprot:3935540-Rhodomonas_salina.1
MNTGVSRQHITGHTTDLDRTLHTQPSRGTQNTDPHHTHHTPHITTHTAHRPTPQKQQSITRITPHTPQTTQTFMTKWRTSEWRRSSFHKAACRSPFLHLPPPPTKSNTSSRIPGTNWTKLAVSCIWLCTIPHLGPAHRTEYPIPAPNIAPGNAKG